MVSVRLDRADKTVLATLAVGAVLVIVLLLLATVVLALCVRIWVVIV